MAYHTTRDKRDDQFLRKAFDAAYEINSENILSVYTSIPKRTKWMIVSSIAALVLVVILFQLSRVAVDAVQWANRTTLSERLSAPYNLEQRSIPVLDTTPYQWRTIPTVDSAALEAQRRAAIEAAHAALPAVEPVTEGAADTTAAAEAPTIDEAAIRASIQPEVDASYFVVMPQLFGFNRTYIYDNVTVHPVMGCLVRPEPTTELPCGLTQQSTFVEAADYTDLNNQVIRVAAVQYATTNQAQNTLLQLFRFSRDQGSMGNYAITLTQPIGYFFASAHGWRTLTWSHENWVFSVSAQSIAQVEAVVQSLPY